MMIFAYDFMIRALVAGIAIALSASLIGVSLVLNKHSLIGDGLSHVGFGSMVIAIALDQQPLIFSMIVAMIAAYFILKVNENSITSGDAMIGIISSAALAIGVIVIQLFNVNADVSSYMFGSILAVNWFDMWMAVVIAVIVVVGYFFLYPRIFAITFDESFSKAVGLNTERYHKIRAILTALVVVVGMRLVGALLISGLIIFPAIIAMRLFASFKQVMIVSAVIGVTNFIIGLIFAAYLNTPTGASVILINLIVLLSVTLYKAIRSK